MKNSNLQPKTYNLTIGWLYPSLMSTYGDRGNIITLTKRIEWRGIGVEVKELEIGFSNEALATCDLLFMGGAQDRQQKIVSADLEKKASILAKAIEDGIPGLYICGAYQFLGTYYKEADGTVIPGLGIFDLYTENPGGHVPRLIGNIVASSLVIPDSDPESHPPKENSTTNDEPRTTNTLVGFENHGGRTYLGDNIKPLAKVVKGFGNNGTDETEGAIYKNSIGSYMHGPILPKNPHLADFLIGKALEKKYGRTFNLGKLMDSLETHAHNEVVKRILS